MYKLYTCLTLYTERAQWKFHVITSPGHLSLRHHDRVLISDITFLINSHFVLSLPLGCVKQTNFIIMHSWMFIERQLVYCTFLFLSRDLQRLLHFAHFNEKYQTRDQIRVVDGNILLLCLMSSGV